MFIVVGLGNPGLEYENTRHNTGRVVLRILAKSQSAPDFEFNKRLNALVSSADVQPRKGVKGKKEKATLLIPETFMNKSGFSVAKLLKSKKAAERLVVIHDDLDIPFGRFKISFNKSSGGHRGVESIIKAIKTQAFVRLRVGIAPSVSAIRKPQDGAAVEKTILGEFTANELTTLKKLGKKISEGLVVLMTEGRAKAMSQYHGSV